MDAHLRGSAASGYGAVPVQRGFPLAPATPTGTTQLLQVTANQPDFPVLVQVKVVVKTPFDAGATVTVAGVDQNGNQTAIVAGELAQDGSVEADYLANGFDTINVTFTANGCTVGQAAVFATIAGVGQL